MKQRLSVLYFLQFGIWGCYLTCFGQFLGAGGIGSDISWFYAAIGIVSIFTPWLMGRIADKTGRPEKLLALCHAIAAISMLAMWRYGMTHPTLDFRVIFPLYLLFLGFYMPTMALSNTATFSLLERNGYNTVATFPGIRIWGTIGFIGAMWFVNTAYWYDGTFGFTFSDSGPIGHHRFQYNAMQLLCSGILGIATALYSLSLPKSEKIQNESDNSILRPKLKEGIRLILSNRVMIIFLVFVILTGVCLQISNGFVTPFITHFLGIREYATSLASGNATMLFSLSQISEAVCILLVGISLKWKGIKWVYALGIGAWGLRFLMLGMGNPSDRLWLLIGSMLIYGIAFNFITIAGHIYIQQIAPEGMKGFSQGLMMFMSNGIGATLGILIAGNIVNRWCNWEMTSLPGGGNMMRLFMGNWEVPWSIFAIYSFIVMILWLIFFRKSRNS